jgi:hypothetical protein
MGADYVIVGNMRGDRPTTKYREMKLRGVKEISKEAFHIMILKWRQKKRT